MDAALSADYFAVDRDRVVPYLKWKGESCVQKEWEKPELTPQAEARYSKAVDGVPRYGRLLQRPGRFASPLVAPYSKA